MRKTNHCDVCEMEGPDQTHDGLRQEIWENQLREHRQIFLNGAVDARVIEMVVAQIMNINDYDDHLFQGQPHQRDAIKLFLTTDGGTLAHAFAVIDCIQNSKTPVWTIALGKAYSAGFLILLAGNLRFAQQRAELIYHDLASEHEGTSTDIREYSDYLESRKQAVIEYVTGRTNITSDELEECHSRKFNWYMDTREAIRLGVVDGIWGCGGRP